MIVSTAKSRSVDERLLQRTPMGDCIHLPVDYFLDHVLPPLPSQVDPREMIDTLKTRGHKSRRAITSQNRWRGFARNPAESLRDESHVFKYLADVVQAIVEASGIGKYDPIVRFQNNPHGGPDYYERDANTLPDAYLHLDNTVDGTVSWMDIAVPGEYKKGCSHTDKQDNIQNISWSICKLLRKDPRRRFTYGYSIENTDMRLWYCDRYRIITTAPFDFMFEHESVVHFFASLIYARPDQLGWDPSIKLLRDDPDNLQYDITVTTKGGEKVTYRTLELLSDLAVGSVIGKGTRIWKVTRLEDGRVSGETAVLKDSWVDKDQPREGDTFHELRNATMPAENHKILMDALLTVETYGDVIIDSGHDAVYPDRTIQLPSSPTPKCARSDFPKWSVGKHKIHHRVVFKEICTPLRHLRPFQYVFKILGEACIVLKVLHQAGWVHRDISSANILTDSTGRVKLIDLEYAKKADDESRRDMRVGTAKFMSVELDRRYYRYRPSPVVSPLPEAPPFDPLYTPSTPTSGTTQTHTPSIPSTPPPPEPEPPFRYNPIHDFESLWWVTTFFVFQMEAAFKSTTPLSAQSRPPRLQDQRMSAKRLSHDQDVRFSVTSKRGDAFMKHVQNLHRSIRPIGEQLETWRVKIIRAYLKAEQTRVPDMTLAMQDLHDEFAKDLFRISNMLAGKTVMTEGSWVTNEPVATVPPKQTSLKRKGEDQAEHRDEPEPEGPADPARSRKKARKSRPVVIVDGPAARTRACLRAKAR